MKHHDILFLDIDDAEAQNSVHVTHQFFERNRASLRIEPNWSAKILTVPTDELPDMKRSTKQQISNALKLKSINKRGSIVIASDHRSTAALISSVERRRLSDIHIVVLDAHSDCQGAVDVVQNYNVMTWITRHYPKVNKSLVGVRDIDSDTTVIYENFVSVHNIDAVHRLGVRGIVGDIEKIIDRSELWLSIDLDVLDPLIFKAVNAPISGGMLPRELFLIASALAPRAFVSEIVEFCPAMANQNEFLLVADLVAQL